MKIALSKIHGGCVPADQQTKDFLDKVKYGGVIHGDFKKMRNGSHHRKLFALLNLAFEYWKPGEIDCKYGRPEKNFDRFRKDLIILAGFYDPVIRLDGTVRIEARSISYAKMDQPEFEKLYNSILTVILKKVDTLKHMAPEEVNDIVNEIVGFG